MGSGKSTVGKQLAAITSRKHVDLDDYIEEQEKDTIQQIIKLKGVIYFRKQERKHLEAVLKESKSIVLSLGGGTPCYYNNMDLIHKSGDVFSIYLRAAVPFLTERLFDKKEHRPLIAAINEKPELAEFIGKHLLERSAFYNMAQQQVNIQDKTPQDIAAEILSLR